MDIASLAAECVAALAPFAGALLRGAESGIETLGDAAAEKSGNAALRAARTLWNRLTDGRQSDGDLHSAIQLTASSPSSALRNELLTQILVDILAADPDLAKDVQKLMSSRRSSQDVSAVGGSRVEGVSQQLSGDGHQSVAAIANSTVSDIEQRRT